MSKYASQTDVSSARSRAEIEDTLARYGASGYYRKLKKTLGEAQVQNRRWARWFTS